MGRSWGRRTIPNTAGAGRGTPAQRKAAEAEREREELEAFERNMAEQRARVLARLEPSHTAPAPALRRHDIL